MQFPSLSLEHELLTRYCIIAGIDEVGRGCLAGPVYACIVTIDFSCLSKLAELRKIRDSKTISESTREQLYELIIDAVHSFGIGAATPIEIDVLGIRKATYRAMLRAYWSLKSSPSVILMDGESATIPIFSKTFQYNHGDALHASIAAASIIAKVSRDRLMRSYELTYPGYGFARHKGYGTKKHYESLLQLGTTPIHRKSFL